METLKVTEQKSKPIFFDVQLNWLSQHRGLLVANDVKDSLHVATPRIFGGEGEEWSPEHLFLGAVSSCFMSTYLVFAKKFGCPISRLECNAKGAVELVDGSYQFTEIHVYPVIHIGAEEFRSKAALALTKT